MHAVLQSTRRSTSDFLETEELIDFTELQRALACLGVKGLEDLPSPLV
ncbi:hypothetical protein [Chlamydia muridarum]|nr:hypothetical protein [Chlamydia muridarum]KDU80055.1 hypothetical protein DU17_0628 [Chlamydia muridarum]KDU81582.1 hypothetical protein DU18_0627 [Chlamydia muridarum]KDU82196.1 hypothetical protein DU19_0626 [Chlamydia muridarum]KDU83536.1 hypothetical protein DU20_0627 [Chlamydia muridarum]KDU84610.1 hypothetical protein DU21_0628 [Chlamydia muridarum]